MIIWILGTVYIENPRKKNLNYCSVYGLASRKPGYNEHTALDHYWRLLISNHSTASTLTISAAAVNNTRRSIGLLEETLACRSISRPTYPSDRYSKRTYEDIARREKPLLSSFFALSLSEKNGSLSSLSVQSIVNQDENRTMYCVYNVRPCSHRSSLYLKWTIFRARLYVLQRERK